MLPIEKPLPGAKARQMEAGHPAMPFLIKDGEWEVQSSSHGSINLGDLRFYAPAGNSPKDLAVRAHEYGHIKWSPEKLPHPSTVEVSEGSMRALEDARVNMLLERSGVRQIADLYQGVVLNDNIFEGAPKRDLVNFYIAAAGTHLRHGQTMQKIMEETLTYDERRIVDNILYNLQDNLTFEKVIELGKEIDAVFPVRSPGSPLDIEDGEPSEFDGDASILKHVLSTMGRRSKNTWGEVKEVKICPLDITVPGVIPGFKRRASDIGPFCHPYRVPPMGDGLVFSHKVRTKGGTVLVDGSGSMSLTASDINKIVQNAPSATVAMYSGSDHDGTIWILARNGLACRPEKYPHRPGGNIIDGPAIQWMLKQQKPHIWVSDGGVTGIHDSIAANLIMECITLVQQNRIHHVKTAKEAIKLLEKFKRR